MKYMFQSTRPLGGAMSLELQKAILESVSIHAPPGGRDRQDSGMMNVAQSFNPRAPWGAR